MNATLQDLQNQIHAHGARLKALERVQQPATTISPSPPPGVSLGQPVMDNPAEAAWYAKAESDPNVQRLLELEAEVAKLTKQAGFLDSNISDMLMINNAVAITLRMPGDWEAKRLPEWATHIMEGK